MLGQGQVEILRLCVIPALLTTSPIKTLHANLAGIYKQILALCFYSLNSILLESCPSPHLRRSSPCLDKGLGSVPGGTHPELGGTGPLPFAWLRALISHFPGSALPPATELSKECAL